MTKGRFFIKVSCFHDSLEYNSFGFLESRTYSYYNLKDAQEALKCISEDVIVGKDIIETSF